MKQLDMKTGEIIDVKYEATTTDKEGTAKVDNRYDKPLCRNRLGSCHVSLPSEIVVVFEPNRPSYEIKKVKP